MADEKMQNENKKSLNTREDNVAEDIRREAAGKDAEMAADKTTEKEGAPKKKNLAFVVRPQNSKNSSRLQGKRPGQGRQGQNQGRPNGDGKRPAAGQSRSNGEGKPARTEKPAAKSERPVRAAEDRPARPAQNGARSERPQGSRTERTGRPSGEGRQVRSDRPDRNHLETDVLMARTEAKTEDHVRTETDADSVLTEEDVTDSRDATTVMEERTVTEETDADRDSALTEEMTIAETTEVTLHRS